MTEEDDAQRMELIKAKASAQAEALAYQMNNPYLTTTQKIEVEFWFQFPGEISFLVMLGTLIYSAFAPLSWYYIIGIPLCTNAVVGVLSWLFYSKSLLHALNVTLCHNFVAWILTVITVILLCIQGAYWKAAFAVALRVPVLDVGIGMLFEPHLLLYSIFSAKYNMAAKYAFFKKQYGMRFPFEDLIEKEM